MTGGRRGQSEGESSCMKSWLAWRKQSETQRLHQNESDRQDMENMGTLHRSCELINTALLATRMARRALRIMQADAVLLKKDGGVPRCSLLRV